MRIMLMEGE